MRISSIIIWLIQLILIIHVFKTGRSRYWIFLLIFMPLIGGIAYLAVEVLPGFAGSISGQRAVRNFKKTLNPGAELRHHEAAWEQSPNVDNARRYAEALLQAGKVSEAEEITNRALKGFYANEPTLLLMKARIQFEQNRPGDALESLESLQEHNPDFRDSGAHLLYAQVLEADGQTEKAVHEYSVVAGYFPGVEARYRLAMCLKASGNDKASKAEMESIVTDAKLAPPHFRKNQKPWLDAVNRELTT